MAVAKNKKVADVKIIDTEKPLPVVLETTEKESQIINKGEGKTLAPNTTEQEDVTKAGQRRINLLWESTQTIIAVMITAAVVYKEIKRIESSVLDNAFFLIVSMYLVRTNHQLIGGVGRKYEGR